MSPSELANASTRKGWRELGFYYDFDKKNKEWRFVGSASGLEKVRNILWSYSNNPIKNTKSEHSHYGPYMYLKIMTWDTPGINDDCIQGTMNDLKMLGDLVAQKLKQALPNSVFVIKEEYSKDTRVPLVFEIKEDGFDPATADPMLEEKERGT